MGILDDDKNKKFNARYKEKTFPVIVKILEDTHSMAFPTYVAR